VNENDRRYRRTHARIREVFETLVLTRSFQEITVSEISRLVGINRKTFYAHYASTMALLTDLVHELIEECGAVNFALGDAEGTMPLASFFEILSRREALHRRLICSPDYGFAFQMIADSLAREKVPIAAADSEDFERRALTVFLSGSVMQVYREWLLADKPIPEAALAAFLEKMIRGCVTAVLPRGTEKLSENHI